MKVGVISDTHIPRRRKALPDFVAETFAGVDLILHAGDINEQSVLDALARLAPVEAVAGNTDPPELVEALGYQKLLELNGFKIGLTHGHNGKRRETPERARASFPDADVVVFGHSHKPLVRTTDGCLLLNPGSPTDKRRQPRYSLGMLYLRSRARGKILYFD
ncbi:MAG: metallophosphoesterase family protein [Firmicutes bacterium]|nr:metallophosphoesterase family protein [Bacillota bacterium]